MHLYINFGLWLMVFIAIMLDLWDGLYTAKKCHARIRSHILRVTANKVGEYWRIMLIGFIVDTIGTLFTWYNAPYVSIIFCLGLVGVEAKSIFEHIGKRKTSASKLPEVLKEIIECASERDAKKVLKRVGEYLEKVDHRQYKKK